jgi:hypothetical protein
MSLGRVQGSGISLHPELTLALAHVNFDFSLIKVDAPVEYEPLGASLSRYRRNIERMGRNT